MGDKVNIGEALRGPLKFKACFVIDNFGVLNCSELYELYIV
jgi:hypothetical protein